MDVELDHLEALEVADPELRAFVMDLRELGRLAPSEFGVLPDVADVVARAHALDPEAVPLEMVTQAGRIELDEAESGPGEGSALGPFVEALRAENESAITERGMAGIPRPPALEDDGRRDGVASGRGRAIGAGIGLLLAVAAAAGALWVLAPQLSHRAEDPSATQAVDAEEGADAGGVARLSQQQPHQGARREVASRADEPPSEAPSPAGEGPDAPALAPARTQAPELAPTEAPEPTGAKAISDAVNGGASERSSSRDGAGRSRRERLAALEADAQVAWAGGDLAEAERLLRRIISLDRKGKAAELAYGDLFAVARRRGGAKAQALVWSEYLERFPRGRFSEDARAGLCGRARGAPARACWEDYLEHHPEGSHRTKARGVLEAAP